jgi:hypothetical protein
MKKYKFDNGTVEVYDNEADMTSALHEILSHEEAESCLDGPRGNGIFNPNNSRPYYVKTIVVIKPVGEYKTCMFLEHWKDDDTNYFKNGFLWHSYKPKSPLAQSLFMEYYSKAHNCQQIEDAVKLIKVGRTIYHPCDNGVEKLEIKDVKLNATTYLCVSLQAKRESGPEAHLNVLEVKNGALRIEGTFFLEYEPAKQYAINELKETLKGKKERIAFLRKDAMELAIKIKKLEKTTE